MKIVNSPDHSLHVTVENSAEWQLLHSIAQDAFVHGGPSDLSSQLSANMCDESEWDSFIVPELTTLFKSQVATVQSALSGANESTTEAGETHYDFTIAPADLDTWYGALNQARHQLEAEHRLSRYCEKMPSDIPPPLRKTLWRDTQYRRLQHVLLKTQTEQLGLDDETSAQS